MLVRISRFEMEAQNIHELDRYRRSVPGGRHRMRVSDALGSVRYRRAQVGEIRIQSASAFALVLLLGDTRCCIALRCVALRRPAASNPFSVEGLLAGVRHRQTRRFESSSPAKFNPVASRSDGRTVRQRAGIRGVCREEGPVVGRQAAVLATPAVRQATRAL